MKKIILLAFTVVSISANSFAQDKKKDNSFVVIVEPFSLLNNGFDIGAGYGFDKNKVEIKYRQTGKSDPVAQQKEDFDTKYNSVELSYNYFLKEHLNGFFIGGTANYFFDYKATEKVFNQTATKDFASLGIRFGYYWYPIKKLNLFIDPTIGLNFNLNDKELSAGGKTFDKQSIRLLPAGMLLRVGYQF